MQIALDLTLSCYATRYPKMGNAVGELLTQCALPPTKETKGYLNCILSNIIKSLQSDTSYALVYPASSATIHKRRKQGASPKLTATLVNVINQLAAKGYILKLSGSNSFGTTRKNGGGHKQNRFLPTPKLVTDIIEVFGLIEVRLNKTQTTDFVVVTKKRDTGIYGSTIKDIIPLAQFNSQDEKNTIRESKRILNKYNQLLSQTSITLSQGTIPTGYAQRVYRRFCRGSLEYGGRLYGGFWQTLGNPKGTRTPNRRDILIDGKPTVELDFTAYHINMLYAWEGHEPLQDDAYTVAHYPREVVKQCFLISLNLKSGDPKGALAAYRDKMDKHPELAQYYPLLLGGGYKEIMEEVKKKHPLISKYLHSDIGVKLQKQDGDIALGVIERMMNLPKFVHSLPIPILCIHDSFICPANEAHLLKLCMGRAYENVMGTKIMPLIQKVI